MTPLTTTARIRTATISATIATLHCSMMTTVIMMMMAIPTTFILMTPMATTARIRTATISATIATLHCSMMTTVIMMKIFFHIVNFLDIPI